MLNYKNSLLWGIILGGVTVLLGFHGYCQIPTFKLNIEWNSTPPHTTKLQNVSLINWQHLLAKENRWCRTSRSPQSSRNRWVFVRAGAEWKWRIKERSACFPECQESCRVKTSLEKMVCSICGCLTHWDQWCQAALLFLLTCVLQSF